jgi:hypothetical protein
MTKVEITKEAREYILEKTDVITVEMKMIAG